MVSLHRAYKDRAQAATALSNRLIHDPFLSDVVHRMLTNISAIRSTAEILESVDDLEAAQQGGRGKHLYEKIYSARGQAESQITAWKAHLAADRTSCSKANTVDRHAKLAPLLG